MNHLCALQRKDGRWDYTYNYRPYGYCKEYKPISVDVNYLPEYWIKEYNEKMSLLINNFHTTGHSTEEEAQECYKNYLLDVDLQLCLEEPVNASQQHKCKICNEWTACYAFVGSYRQFCLCPEHQTKEFVASLLKVGESWES